MNDDNFLLKSQYCDLSFVSYPLFIGSKAIALPCKIQESLLCQSSDAKQVVLQLQETLQPDQASLEEPGPETKQLIRCLARAAKDSNRHDVFEHLREITPAGTTGESDTEISCYQILVFPFYLCILNCWQ